MARKQKLQRLLIIVLIYLIQIENMNDPFKYRHPLKLHPGGSNSRNDPGVRLVSSNSTRRAEHAHLEETS